MKINQEIAVSMLKALPEKKKSALEKAMERNCYLTSDWHLGAGSMTVYIEGFYLALEGCRCKFAVYARDNDGTLEVLDRKPNEKNLHKLYVDKAINAGMIQTEAGF